MARTFVSVVGSNIQACSGPVSMVVDNKNQLRNYSRVAACANERPSYQVFHVFDYTYATSRNLRHCRPQACAEGSRETKHAAAGTCSSTAGRVSTIPAGSMALVRLGRLLAGHHGEPLFQAPSTTPSPSSPRICRCGMPAPNKTFKERTHILAVVR